MIKINKEFYFIITATLLLALFGGGKIPYLIFYTISGGLLFSFFWTIIIYKNISGYQKISEHEYYTGDKINILSYIDSETILPAPHIEINDKTSLLLTGLKSNPCVTALKPMERYVYRTDFNAKYRGLYNIGPLEICVKDIFGMFKLEKTIYSNTNFNIYPKLYMLSNFNLKSYQSFGTLSTKVKAYEDNTSVSDIKKYAIGDNVKKIHWKVSAKKGSLFVKNYEMTGTASAYIFVDFHYGCYRGENSRDLEERAAEAASSIAYFLLKNITSVYMYINNDMVSYVKGRDVKEFKGFLNVLSEAKVCGDSRMKDVLQKRISLISSSSSIIIITGTISREDTEIYCQIKDMGYDIIIIYSADLDLRNNKIEKIKNMGIKIFTLNYDSDVKGVLETL